MNRGEIVDNLELEKQIMDDTDTLDRCINQMIVSDDKDELVSLSFVATYCVTELYHLVLQRMESMGKE